jgi:hypothetical protein
LFNQPANLGSGGRPASPTALGLGQPGPESAKPFALPPNHRVRFHVQQRTSPAAPNAGQTDPEQPIEGCQSRSLAHSLECRELQPEGSILHRDRPMAAQQESDESKDGQKQTWHVSRLFVSIPIHVKLLADGPNNGEGQLSSTPEKLTCCLFLQQAEPSPT